ncbi:MAG: 3-isopropylmalate dehydratase small subunit [Nitrosarchaeum sp.]|nr:3-isopropylmalate dehydratase small subunit [Nitrosarchaeum sp.]MBP0120620.1 3-isopropylmalate dehydratase small subunit [Nitrosarchaeum sp.]MBP0134150.1 3-isopropylmalate dehydratase small subunit [Nitrosarchaeum sp.]
MKSFKTLKSIITPLDKVNVDTDQIVPKQFLKLVQKSGFGKFLFYNWRFGDDEQIKSDFILNNPKYKNSEILVAGDNFGCGSSREHAVWALMDYGFSVIIAPSFADIFFSNCFKNGLLPIILSEKIVEKIQHETGEVEIDLENQLIKTPSEQISFDIDLHKKTILLKGLDDISQTLLYEKEISEFEKNSTIPSVL